jgi:DnaJ-class molecular chaperone
MSYKMQQCTECKGSGLVRREKTFFCSGFHSPTIGFCVYCENVNRGLYVECEKCYGDGRVKANPPELNIMTR